MADIITLIASVIVGVICTLIYISKRRKANPIAEAVRLETIFTLFLRSGGFIGGISLMIYTFWDDINKYLLISKLHIFLGGVAVFYISLMGILSDIRNVKD